MTTNTTELTEQPRPSDSRCPACGAEPTDESVTEHKLSDLGYLHDDVFLECAADDCDETWVCGVPVGSSDEFADDLWCESCDDEWMLVHRVLPQREGVTLHLKCPSDTCNYFTTTTRDTDDSGRALVGYPIITGETEGAKPYGWSDE